jgi:HPt (histidine-containing phosphotransfer) domain-containing protein
MPDTNETQPAEKIIVHVDSDLEDLLPGFLDDWKGEIESIREALERDDYETIRKLGHNMKGTGGSCGLEEITEMGRNLEEAAKAMAPEAIRVNLDTLSSYLARVELVYE